jgi:hypothetical protein
MVRRLEEVRPYFTYNPAQPQSAWGLALLDLAERRRRGEHRPTL